MLVTPAAWIRSIDTIYNLGAEALNLTMVYKGNYGSDSSTIFHELNDYLWVR